MDANDAQLAQAEKDEREAMEAIEEAGKPTETAVTETPPAAEVVTPAAETATETPAEVVTPAVTETSPQKIPTETDTLAQKKAELEAEIASLAKKKRDLAGEYGGELSRRSQQEVARVNAELTTLRQEIATLKAAKTTSPATETEIPDDKLLEGVPEADRAVYADMLKASARVARNATKADIDRIQAAQAEQLAQIKQRQEQQEAAEVAQQTRALVGQVESRVKGFAAVNGLDGSNADPQWAEHLDTIKPGTRVTWRQSIQSVAADPVEESAAAFKAFQRANGTAEPEKPAPRSTAGQVQPRKNGVQPSMTEPKTTDPTVAYNELLTQLENRKISQQEFDEKSAVLDRKLGWSPGR